MKNLKAIIITILFMSFAINAQQSESSYDKLKKLNKEAKSVVLTVDGEEITFEGKEAESFLKQLRMLSLLGHSIKDVDILTDDDFVFNNEDGVQIEIFKSDGDAEMVFLSEDDLDENRIEEKVTIEDENGVMKITIKKTENGEESTEVLEGEDAEKYLVDMEKLTEIEKLDGNINIHKFFQKTPGKGKRVVREKSKCCCKGGVSKKRVIIKEKLPQEQEED